MSKILEASCVAGVVTADSLPVVGAVILSEGVAPSSGVLILDEDRKHYVAKTSPDLKTTIEKLILTLTDVVTALTSTATALAAIDAKPLGALPPAPAAAAAIAVIAAKTATLTATGVELSVLKELLK